MNPACDSLPDGLANLTPHAQDARQFASSPVWRRKER
jgi:hypothetical protein